MLLYLYVSVQYSVQISFSSSKGREDNEPLFKGSTYGNGSNYKKDPIVNKIKL